MEEKQIHLLNTYSCQFCFKEFKTSQDLIYEIGITPFCSNKCKFKWVYNFLKNAGFEVKYLNLTLSELGLIKKEEAKNESEALFLLTKYCSSIIPTRILGTKGQDKKETKLGRTKGQRDKSAIYSTCPYPCPSFCPYFLVPILSLIFGGFI